MTQAITRPKTLAEFLNAPFTGRMTEFVNGAIVEVGTHDPSIGRIIKKLVQLLDAHIEAVGVDWEALAESSTVAIPSRENGRVPDIVVATHNQWDAIENATGTATFLQGNPPALVVEVVSKNSKDKDYNQLPTEYALARVPEYWIVEPNACKVTVLTLHGESYQEQVFTGPNQIISATFPALDLTVDQIFARYS